MLGVVSHPKIANFLMNIKFDDWWYYRARNGFKNGKYTAF